MRITKIIHVYVITHTGSICCVVILTENIQDMPRTMTKRKENIRDQVRFRLVRFTQLCVRVSTCGSFPLGMVPSMQK